ncbi:MAG: hypothetical protein US60_C0002G0030 [Microgenomates group bacterium GW2011_GWC1_37_8]|uniref:Phage-Barnase-EndoU-ColicinE5/D-RelE like nuclease 2 domain-containing protein n=1 Tax=Candidatus Woesebacteria bacterium GW2011_GWB1_38_8 TaxID=1618570 RepID=A0A0G0L0J9_9BACT|nr:MAG: hypothetical protein US60_C0002G0030 [Microgenomates group bacterium GW2011_GWC1_37_8]KKQ85468.1 MAG: hypothetical protein UT08_C0006G0051 [Candidatus Woesebacteria bacterium GW2011_GWB1_38_8]
MDKATISKNGIAVRLTEERMKHILLMHPNLVDKQDEILRAVKNPDCILKGKAGELLAVLGSSKKTYLVVVYKEFVKDGFIITAFETTDTTWLFKKEIIWNKLS